jgi:hypothetical protein
MAAAKRPPTRWIEAVPFELHVDRGAHPAQDGQERLGDEIERRRRWIVRPTFENELRRLARDQHGWQYRLQDQCRAAGCPDGELIVTSAHCSRFETQDGRAQRDAGGTGPADGRCRLNRRQVLSQQARFFPSGPDSLDAKRTSGDERQRQRGPQDLAAAFTSGAVDDDRFHGRRSSAISSQ